MPYVGVDEAGQHWLFDDQDRPLRKLSGGNAGPPADPTFGYKGPQAQADLAGKVVSNQGTALNNQNTARTLRQQPISTEDQAVINRLREGIGPIDEALQGLNGAAGVIDRFRTGPNRAATVNAAIVPPDAGWLDMIGPNIRKALSGVSDQDIADYQSLKRYSNEAVLQKSIEQKGPQTESDAIRMAMTGITPDKDHNVNARIIGDNTLRGLIAKGRPDFYVKWANRNGSLNTLENGKSVDEAWSEHVNAITSRYNSDPRIRRLSGNAGAPRKSQGGGAWKIERIGN